MSLSKPETYEGKPCAKGHSLRYVRTNRCAQCARDRAQQWQATNPERAKENWRNRDREKARSRNADHYQAAKEIYKKKALGWSRSNPIARYKATRKWAEKNRDKRALYGAKRREAVRRATPSWVDQKEIASFYKEAQRLTELTGIRHSVDHIMPLMGKNLSGLHVPWNLQVIPFAENCRKGNRVASH